MIDRGVALALLGDPRTPGADLAGITQAFPDLWASVAAHPGVYPQLLDWLAAHGDAAVNAAVQATRSRWTAPPAGLPGPVPGQPVSAGTPYPGSPYPPTPYQGSQYPGAQYPGAQPNPGAALASAGAALNQALNSMTGFQGATIVSFGGLFKDSFKKHGREDMDALMYAGTAGAEGDNRWRLPWLYVRVFGVLMGSFALLWLCYIIFKDSAGNIVPGVAFTGALAMPATVMIFFWEFNQARNVSFFDVIRIFLIGGALSLLLTFVLSAVTDALPNSSSGVAGAFLEATLVSFAEEVAKIAAVWVFARRLRGCLVSNGLLVGAIVGAGFAVFETMGYAMRFAAQGMLTEVLVTRGVLSLGGHVAWAAISGAGLMLVQRPGTERVDLATMAWPKFLGLLAVPFVLHLLWDFFAFTIKIDTIRYSLFFLLIAVAWVFLVRLINTGLRQYALLNGQPSGNA